MLRIQQSCPPGSTPYSIRSGDTFYQIAVRNNIPLQALLDANPGVNPDRLFIGQIICIPSSTPPTPPTSKCPTLRIGSQGASVVELQQLLRNAGFNPGAIDGIFGQGTQSAVIAFQRSKGLTPDGVVGVATWTALGVNCGVTPPPTNKCPTLRIGSQGASVVELQQLLRNAGFNPGAIDGIFGQGTQSAVIAFQRSKGLTPDGVVGVATWTALGVNCGVTPPPNTCPTGTQPYTVKSGDNFYDLARRFNTTVEAIQRANPTVNPNALQIGQIICIPM